MHYYMYFRQNGLTEIVCVTINLETSVPGYFLVSKRSFVLGKVKILNIGNNILIYVNNMFQ